MGIFRRWIAWVVWITCAAITTAAPIRVLAIGDSLTEEYRFEIPFSAPKSLIPPVANTTNWVEILATHRTEHFSLGSYNSTPLYYGDLRNTGYKYNYGVPGFTSEDWMNVIEANPFDFSAIGVARTLTRTALVRHLGEIDAVVIFLGGNDLKSDFNGIFNDPEPPPVMDRLVENLGDLHDFIRSRKSKLPILIATAPDIGATHEIASLPQFADPVRKLRSRQRVSAMNQEILALAASRNATPIRIDSITDRIEDSAPFHLNGTEFIFTPDDNNEPHHIFCHDGFHPASMAQALIGNLVLEALNHATGAAIPLMQNREILAEVVGLNPDQPYLDWAGSAGGMQEDPDGDGLPNLAEFVLGGSPFQADSPMTFLADGELRFHPEQAPLRFAEIHVEESTTLNGDWTRVPESRKEIQADGTWRIEPAGPKRFYRLATTPRP